MPKRLKPRSINTDAFQLAYGVSEAATEYLRRVDNDPFDVAKRGDSIKRRKADRSAAARLMYLNKVALNLMERLVNELD